MSNFWSFVRHHALGWKVFNIVFFGALFTLPVLADELGSVSGLSFKNLPPVAYYTFGLGCMIGYGFAMRTQVASERDKAEKYKTKADKYDNLMEDAYSSLHRDNER